MILIDNFNSQDLEIRIKTDRAVFELRIDNITTTNGLARISLRGDRDADYVFVKEIR